MIPKIIHYCWFSGDQYPELIENCINSWKKHLPDYEIILWDAERIKSCSNLWLEQTLEKHKYAFGADYIRFYALYHYGGIYLDSDVEVLKSFNPLLDQQQFLGEEYRGDVEAAVLGAEKGLDWVKECLDYYKDKSFILPNGEMDITPVPLIVNEIIAKYKDIEIYHYTYFSPKNPYTFKISSSSETFCIHRFTGSWAEKQRTYHLKKKIHRYICLIIGRNIHNKIMSIVRNFRKLNKQ